MPIILSHSSALERLRAIPPAFDDSPIIQEPISLPKAPSVRRLNPIEMQELGISQTPVSILTQRQSNPPKTPYVKIHMQSVGPIPGNLLLQAGPDVYASGPELAFIQMAGQLSFVGLVVLGFELCGSYSHFAPKVSGFYERAPLTTKDQIESAINLFKSLHGRSAARKALPYVLEGSASPMETVLACMLTFPPEMGGEGFKLPVPNKEVTLSKAGARITKTGSCKVDLAWPDARIGLEYAGGPYHTDEKKDRLRLEALAHEKWTIYTADIDRLANYAEYEALVSLIEDEIPRTPGAARAKKSASKRLFERLMRATRAGMSVSAALFGTAIPYGAVKIHFP